MRYSIILIKKIMPMGQRSTHSFYFLNKHYSNKKKSSNVAKNNPSQESIDFIMQFAKSYDVCHSKEIGCIELHQN